MNKWLQSSGRHRALPSRCLRILANGFPAGPTSTCCATAQRGPTAIVKTVWHHRWTVHILHKNREEVRPELTNKSVEERIGGDLVTAARQLHAENPAHSLLNFVLLVNRDSEASLGILSDVLTEKPPRLGGAQRPAMTRWSKRFSVSAATSIFACGPSRRRRKSSRVEACLLFNPSSSLLRRRRSPDYAEKLISLEPAA